MPSFDDELPPSAPPNFRGLDPHLPIDRYERHLPHWRQTGATYFVTFRLVDSLPQEKLKILDGMRKQWLSIPSGARTDQNAKDYAQVVLQKIVGWLDAGYGACWFREQRFADELQRAVFHRHGSQHFVPVGAIMPNHCHLVIRPIDSDDLEDLLGEMKSVVARFINRDRKSSGRLWQQESYDRIIRDTEHLLNVVQYIGRNPARANLPHKQWHRWIDPSWEAAGWRFVDVPL